MRAVFFFALLLAILALPSAVARTGDEEASEAARVDQALSEARRVLADTEASESKISKCFPQKDSSQDVPGFTQSLDNTRANFGTAGVGYLSAHQAWRNYLHDQWGQDRDGMIQGGSNSVCGAPSDTTTVVAEFDGRMARGRDALKATCADQKALTKKFRSAHGGPRYLLPAGDCRPAANAVKKITQLLSDAGSACVDLLASASNEALQVQGSHGEFTAGCTQLRGDEEEADRKADAKEGGHEKFMKCEHDHGQFGFFSCGDGN